MMLSTLYSGPSVGPQSVEIPVNSLGLPVKMMDPSVNIS